MVKKIVLTLLVISLLFTRVFQLGQYPTSLNWDEVSHGYNAYSILKTSKDQWGVKLPIFNFRAYGDYPTTLNMYATIPFIATLGLNEFAIRLFTALMGVLTVISVYKLSDYFGLKNKLTLLILLTFSTTLFFTSRGVFQSTVASGLYFFGLYLFLSISKPNLGLILLVSSQFAYHNTRLIVPIVLLYFFISSKERFQAVDKKALAICCLITLLSLSNLFTNKEALARNKWVSIFGIEATNTINQRRLEFGPNNLKNRLVNNKLTYSLEKITKNYFWFFSPQPLFVSGTANYQFNIPGFPILQIIIMPFFYLGLAYLAKIKKQVASKDLLMLILIGMLPAALTQGDFPILRLSTVIPLFFLVIAMGLNLVPSRLQVLKYLILAIYLVTFILFSDNYINSYPQKHAGSWQYGYKELVAILKEKYSQYPEIIITKRYGEPHEFLLFYWPWEPKLYQEDKLKNTDFHADWYWVDGFDKFKFVNDWELGSYLKNTSGKKLVVASPDSAVGTPTLVIKNELDKSDKSTIFMLYEVQ